MQYCLPKQFLEKIKQAIMDGKISVDKFNTDSKTRREMLTELVGQEHAEQINTIYEQKLLLKNQEGALYKTIEDITGISAQKKAELKAKIKENAAERRRKLYDPAEQDNYLNELTSDIYSKKYGTEVSLEQAQAITGLSQDVREAREKIGDNLDTYSKEDGLNFGAKKVAFGNYVSQLKLDAAKEDYGGLVNPLKAGGVYEGVQAVLHNAKVSFNFIAETTRAVVASMDDSFWGRQGLRALLDPRTSKLWVKDFIQSFRDIYRTILGDIGGDTSAKDIFLGKDAIKAGEAIKDSVMAEIYSRPNYLKGRYDGKVGEGQRGERLDIGTGEEAYPTTWVSKIPVFGRFFAGSNVAYEAGAMRLRADIADKVYSMNEKTGQDLSNNKIIGDLNTVINGMTGRGSFGRGASAAEAVINSAFFSVKFFKSNLDYLTVNQGRLSSPAGKLAATNLLYTAATTGVMMGLIQQLWPDDNKDIFNATSSNFGKMRMGNMTVDLTHGAGGIVVMMAKILSQSSTNASTGITMKLGEGYGSQNGMDVVWNFTENKFSPIASVLRDIVRQKTFDRKTPTVGNELKRMTTPISVANIEQFKTEPAARQIFGLIADGFGLSVNVFVPTKDWGENATKEMSQFKEQVGDESFKEANDEYNKQYNEWLTSIKKEWQDLSNEEKTDMVVKEKARIKKGVLQSYGFKYKPEGKK